MKFSKNFSLFACVFCSIVGVFLFTIGHPGYGTFDLFCAFINLLCYEGAKNIERKAKEENLTKKTGE